MPEIKYKTEIATGRNKTFLNWTVLIIVPTVALKVTVAAAEKTKTVPIAIKATVRIAITKAMLSNLYFIDCIYTYKHPKKQNHKV